MARDYLQVVSRQSRIVSDSREENFWSQQLREEIRWKCKDWSGDRDFWSISDFLRAEFVPQLEFEN